MKMYHAEKLSKNMFSYNILINSYLSVEQKVDFH